MLLWHNFLVTAYVQGLVAIVPPTTDNAGEEDRREHYGRIAIKEFLWRIEGLIGRSLQRVSNRFRDFIYLW